MHQTSTGNVPGVNEAFYADGDTTVAKVRVVSSLALNRNTSSTFDPINLICRACPRSHVVGQSEGQNRLVFILSDQCFPAMAPPEGGLGCLAIIRMEDGTLKELANLFVESIKCRSLPRGTVVAISAGGHIARVGVAGYAWDLIEAIDILKKALPPASFVAHGPIAFARGVGDMATIRAVADVCTWQAKLAKDKVLGDFLPLVNMATVRLLERRGTAGTQPPFPLRLCLPANMAGTQKKVWSSSGTNDLPLATLPLEVGDEAVLLYYLTTELNRKLDSGLGTQVNTAPHDSKNVCDTLKLVGNSHAEKLAAAAQSSGRMVELNRVPALTH